MLFQPGEHLGAALTVTGKGVSKQSQQTGQPLCGSGLTREAECLPPRRQPTQLRSDQFTQCLLTAVRRVAELRLIGFWTGRWREPFTVNRLAEGGNTMMVIEHKRDVTASAD